jgi:hypothetical protein
MKIDMNKKYISDGKPIRILCTDRNDGKYPVIGISNEGSIITFTEDGKSPAWPTYNLVEAWEPQPSEWCLFWNIEKPHFTILGQFQQITWDGRFQSNVGTTWTYCAKFDGTLPKHLREDIKC